LPSILLVDDERLLVKGLKRSLENEGYQVLAAYDGLEALELLDRQSVDLVILDIMLPQIDGFEVCRRLRKKSSVPVIMLTARGDDVDKIVGLELGADDYLAKPFNTRELIARIKAVLRRVSATTAELTPGPGKDRGYGDEDKIIKAGNLVIDPLRQQVRRGDEILDLTAREFELLYTLARHPGRIYSREILLEQVWGSRYFGEQRVVDVYIRRLRQKIEYDPANPRWVITRWGAGYYLQENSP